MYARKKVDFHFTAPITRDLFITDRQYQSFQKKADILGIKVVKPSIEDLYIQYGGFQKYKQEVLAMLPESTLNQNEFAIEALVKALKTVQGTHNCYRNHVTNLN